MGMSDSELFRKELDAGTGNITVWSILRRGCVCGGADLQHADGVQGNVTVKVDALAASAASMIAMAGTTVLMSPVAMMIHNPMTIAIGIPGDAERQGRCYDEVKESIMNAYEIKTGLNRTRFPSDGRGELDSMRKGSGAGFADGILQGWRYGRCGKEGRMEGVMFSRTAVAELTVIQAGPGAGGRRGTPVEQLEKRLNLLVH